MGSDRVDNGAKTVAVEIESKRVAAWWGNKQLRALVTRADAGVDVEKTHSFQAA